MKITINVHSLIDVITNSSSEIFIIDNEKSEDIVKTIIYEKCKDNNYDLEWFNNDLSISILDNGNIEIYSFINGPEWLNEFIENNFNVIKSDYFG